MQASTSTPGFEFPADVSSHASTYRVLCPHNGASETSYEVCGPADDQFDIAELRKEFIEDMKRPAGHVEWPRTGDDFDDASPDYAPRLALHCLAAAACDDAEPCARTYLAFARDASGRVVGYSAASFSLSFFLPNGSFDPVDFDGAMAWIVSSKRRNLKAYLRINLEETYTLADFRGAGASTATMDYLSGIFYHAVLDLVAALGQSLLDHRKNLEFDFELYSEWESKSGCLASGTLLSELESAVPGLRADIQRQGLPVKLPKSFNYDAGF